VFYAETVTSAELKRWLERRGCTIEPGRGGHLLVRRGRLKTSLPIHGSGHDLPKGTVGGIKKELGLK
jgi:mRNA interferase HicA